MEKKVRTTASGDCMSIDSDNYRTNKMTLQSNTTRKNKGHRKYLGATSSQDKIDTSGWE